MGHGVATVLVALGVWALAGEVPPPLAWMANRSRSNHVLGMHAQCLNPCQRIP
jgi:hypothetical protein